MSEFVDLTGIDPEIAAARLTMAGLEVAAVRRLCPAGLEQVVSAAIIDLRAHPEADKLTLCRVSDGQNELEIVCGARNMKAGDRVALAPVGATLPNGLTIKKSKIRGELSCGMLCSAAELGFEAESAGIMILSNDVALGQPVVELLGLQDTILEVEITPNRGDCLSVIGVARELAAIFERRFSLPEPDFSEEAGPVAEKVTITVSDSQLCPRYVGRVVEDVVLGESPLWLKSRLLAAGVRAISNVVDVTNYVMLETGQPLHAFDLDQLEQGRIEVRRAGDESDFTTLDGVQRRLDPETLMICDARSAIAVAGIMGGLNSEINPQTRNVLLESAFFQPASIRRSARRLNLSTEASYRFERGVDSEATARVVDRAAELLHKIAGGRVCRGQLDVCADPRPLFPIELRISQVNNLLGLNLESNTIKNILKRLQLKIIKEDEQLLTVVPPAWRFDLEREVDLIEEVARIYGYDQISVTPARISDPEVLDDEASIIQGKIRRLMSACGFNEAVNYSFIDPQTVALLRFPATERFYDFVRLRNPISSEMAVMRTSLLPGLLLNLRDNLRVNVKDIRLFEIGRNFFQSCQGKLPCEELCLAGVVCGRREAEHFSTPEDLYDFFDLKGLLETIAAELGVELNFIPENYYNCLTPGRSATIMLGRRPIGSLGLLHEEVAGAFDIEPETYGFELSLGFLVEAAGGRRVVYQGVTRYPPVYRDLAFLFDVSLPAAEILEYLRGQHKLLAAVEVFDVFQSDALPQGKKSLGFRLTFQDLNKTLTDKKVNAIITQLIKGVEEKFAGTVR
ncbi:MAG: phenylalanine--tRNA ligase subunit beta [Deltaproteobacteria bacterium]|nr:phenylalanine--tRNA ligase subunit beta [Deltaproteobacteria bacterium]